MALLEFPIRLVVIAMLLLMLFITIHVLNLATSIAASVEKYTEKKLNMTGFFTPIALAYAKLLSYLLPALPVLIMFVILIYKKWISAP